MFTNTQITKNYKQRQCIEVQSETKPHLLTITPAKNMLQTLNDGHRSSPMRMKELATNTHRGKRVVQEEQETTNIRKKT